MKPKKKIFSLLKNSLPARWLREQEALAVTEGALLFPMMISLLMAVYDIGQGVVVNQKNMTASQIVGDLITRYQQVNMDLIDDITTAGEMAFDPYQTESYGFDIVSVQFDDDGDAVQLWRVTNNMSPNLNALSDAQGLGDPGEGVIVVSVGYRYEPFFSKYVFDGIPYLGNFTMEEIKMMEVAFLRGRRVAVIPCTDCP